MLGRGLARWRHAAAYIRGRKVQARLGEKFKESGQASGMVQVLEVWRGACHDRKGRRARARLGERFRESGQARVMVHVLEVWWGMSCQSPDESMRMARIAGRALIKSENEVRVEGVGLRIERDAIFSRGNPWVL
jgi:uncharacterized membrane protein